MLTLGFLSLLIAVARSPVSIAQYIGVVVRWCCEAPSREALLHLAKQEAREAPWSGQGSQRISRYKPWKYRINKTSN